MFEVPEEFIGTNEQVYITLRDKLDMKTYYFGVSFVEARIKRFEVPDPDDLGLEQ